MTTAPAPGTPAWAAKVTASKVAAILGLSPWESPYSMWLRMRGDIASDDGSNADAKARGHYLEDGICRWWLDQHPGEHADVETQAYRERDEWAAATPDLLCTLPDGRRVVVDAKTSGSGDDWTDEPPAHYVAQAIWQMWVCDADEAWIAALLGPRLTLREYRIERDRELEAQVVARCRTFYDSLAADDAPDLDDSLATYEAVRALHPDIDRDLAVDIDRDLAHEWVTAKAALADATARERGANTRVRDLMGRARLAVLDGQTIARRQPSRDAVALVAVARHVDPPTPDNEIPA